MLPIAIWFRAPGDYLQHSVCCAPERVYLARESFYVYSINRFASVSKQVTLPPTYPHS